MTDSARQYRTKFAERLQVNQLVRWGGEDWRVTEWSRHRGSAEDRSEDAIEIRAKHEPEDGRTLHRKFKVGQSVLIVVERRHRGKATGPGTETRQTSRRPKNSRQDEPVSNRTGEAAAGEAGPEGATGEGSVPAEAEDGVSDE